MYDPLKLSPELEALGEELKKDCPDSGACHYYRSAYLNYKAVYADLLRMEAADPPYSDISKFAFRSKVKDYINDLHALSVCWDIIKRLQEIEEKNNDPNT